MRKVIATLSLLLFCALFCASFSTYGQAQAPLVNTVRALIARQDLSGADREARAYQSKVGPTPELAAALSWLARAALQNGNLDGADAYAAETRKLGLQLLGAARLDDDAWLPTAIGASIEVHAQVLAARGERPEAIAFLREQLKQFAATSLPERIRKNINLLTLEGKPAPALDAAQWLGSKPPALAALRGHPVLLFFWAHWCSDCKAEVAVLASLKQTFGPEGLIVVGPTRLYGYAAGGEPAAPAAEKAYIEKIRGQYYSALGDMAVPLSAANFLAYGASSTPTLALIDRAGVVRYYHPGAVSEAELNGRIRSILK
jgi:thiol-disulfide isomerase/thioredoxin